MPAPRGGGKAKSKAEINFWTIVLQSVTKRAMPAPGGKRLYREGSGSLDDAIVSAYASISIRAYR